MFFCDKCQYMFNITKDVKRKQIGGKINKALNNVFDKILKMEKISEEDLNNIQGKDLVDDERFETMNKRDQRKIISMVKSINKNFFVEDEEVKIGSNIAYFICRFCKNYKPITPGTLIYSKSYNTNRDNEIEDYSYAIYDSTLSRTRNYICRNEKCPTHKNSEDQEAVLTKNSLDQIVYVCTVCTTDWVNSIQ